MLQIGICDDSPEQAAQFKQRLSNGQYTSQELQIHLYHSALELLESCPAMDFLFLDIEMPEMSGMEFLEKHGTLFADTRIIFLTSHDDLVFEGYRYPIYRFLSKNSLSDEVLFELFQTFERESVLEQALPVRSEGKTVSILLKEIMYVEACNNYCYIVTPNQRWKSYVRLKELHPLLPEKYFFQTHQSFIINMKYIKHIVEQEHYLIMNDNYRIDISQRKRKAFKKLHTDFLLRQ